MKQAKFSIGQCIQHRLHDFRGVVVDVDASFRGGAVLQRNAADGMAGEPWYYVLVDNTDREAYVSEHNLLEDNSGVPVHHPLLDTFLVESAAGCYQSSRTLN